ncbi:MAG: 3-dehydroquinate dehydratase [Candidatus Dormibacteraeota bacterium]|nr:3-dehydroquinate dehydratase [Candidatus Dormibacteraeota bacterium]MBV9524319.1 3-dehydroquinate dehydratase [Candidatus Dormibacteraeota bacterium]
MSRVLLLNGPNLGTLGQREPEVYGTTTLAEIEAVMQRRAGGLGLELRTAQSNHEGELVDILEAERAQAYGCVINPGGLAHTSVVLADAVRSFGHPVIEVHLSNIHAREPYRRVSLCAEAATATVSGLGAWGYVLALDALARILTGVSVLEDEA